jgi:NAD(P)H-nitrite reductase large subunit
MLQDDRLVGVAMVGGIEQGGVMIALMQRQLPLSVDPELLLEPSFNIGTLAT